METIFDKLKKYLDDTPKEKIMEDWNKSKEWDKVGITIDRFIELQQIKTTK